MGCICSKGIRANEYIENDVKNKEVKKTSKRLVSSRRDHESVAEADGNGNDVTESLIANPLENDNVASNPVSSDEGEKKKVSAISSSVSNPSRMPRIVSLVNGEKGAQIVAGWPSWLTAVAGEAINGWVPRRADSFEKLDKVSLVYDYLVAHFFY